MTSAIQIRDLSLSLGRAASRVDVLKSISLDFPDRQVTGMIGPSGCGKSTLLRVLNPLLDAADVVAPSRAEAMTVVAGHAREALVAAAAEAGLPDAAIEVVEVEHGEDVAEAIGRSAEAQGATMVVISSRRVASVAGVVLGSVTQEVLRCAPCPVLVVRA